MSATPAHVPEYVVTVGPLYGTPEERAPRTRTVTLTADGNGAAAVSVAQMVTGSKNKRVALANRFRDGQRESFPEGSDPIRFMYEDRRAKATIADWEVVVRFSDAEIAHRVAAAAAKAEAEERERADAAPMVEAYKRLADGSPFSWISLGGTYLSLEIRDGKGLPSVEIKKSVTPDLVEGQRVYRSEPARVSVGSADIGASDDITGYLARLTVGRMVAAYLDATYPGEFPTGEDTLRSMYASQLIVLDGVLKNLIANGVQWVVERVDGKRNRVSITVAS